MTNIHTINQAPVSVPFDKELQDNSLHLVLSTHFLSQQSCEIATQLQKSKLIKMFYCGQYWTVASTSLLEMVEAQCHLEKASIGTF